MERKEPITIDDLLNCDEEGFEFIILLNGGVFTRHQIQREGKNRYYIFYFCDSVETHMNRKQVIERYKEASDKKALYRIVEPDD